MTRLGYTRSEFARLFASDADRAEPTRVYFIGCTSIAAVKIGVATDARARLHSIQVANALEVRLLIILFGGEDREQRLHQYFLGGHIRGEWFHWSPAIDQFIAAFRDEEKEARRRPIARKVPTLA